MKKIIFLLFVLALLQSKSSIAQGQLWEEIILFDIDNSAYGYAPLVLYYDSAEDVSYIGGGFMHINDTLCNLIKWGASGYTLMNVPFTYTTSCIKYKDKIYVGGDRGLAIWDGSNWTLIDSSELVCGFRIDDDKLYVCIYNSIAGYNIRGVAVWNDTVWTDFYGIDTVFHRPNQSVGHIIPYKGKFYVSGKFVHPVHSGFLGLMVFDPASQQWTDVGGFTIGALDFVTSVLVWQDTLYVSGMFSEAGGSPGNCIAKWDGENWHRLEKGLSRYIYSNNTVVNSMHLYNDEIYVTGNFNIMDGILLDTTSRGYAKWNGSRWCSMGTHIDKRHNISISSRNDGLYIMGNFKQINGMPAQYIAKWIGGNYTDSCSEPLAVRLPVAEMSIHAYPNPSADVFNVSCIFKEMGAADVVLAIMDITGRVISETGLTLKPGVNTFALDLKGLPRGSYFMHINGTDVKGSLQLVKQ